MTHLTAVQPDKLHLHLLSDLDYSCLFLCLSCLVLPAVDISSAPQRTVNVLAGKTLELDLPIVGRPPPVCSWYFADNKMKVTDRVKIKSTGKFSKLTVSDTTIDDTGDYTLEVKNAVGVIREVIKVIILCMYHPSPLLFLFCGYQQQVSPFIVSSCFSFRLKSAL